MNNLLSKNYANALYEISLNSNQVLEFKDELRKISDIFNNKELMIFLSHPNITKDKKKELLKKIITTNKMINNFLMILIDKNIASYITNIYREFKILADKYLNILVVDCFSAKELDKQQIKDLTKTLNEKFNQEIEVNVVVDTSLLAGIKLNINGLVFDNTALNALNNIREKVNNINLKEV